MQVYSSSKNCQVPLGIPKFVSSIGPGPAEILQKNAINKHSLPTVLLSSPTNLEIFWCLGGFTLQILFQHALFQAPTAFYMTSEAQSCSQYFKLVYLVSAMHIFTATQCNISFLLSSSHSDTNMYWQKIFHS